MPYIATDRRRRFHHAGLPRLMDEIAQGCTPGDLNFLVTTLCVGYLQSRDMSYTFLNDVIGVLEAAKLEFYRRAAAPYEDGKIAANGDVYQA